MSSRAAVLAGRDFRWLVVASAFNSVGFGGDFVLIGLLPLLATGSSGWVGVAIALYHVPQLLLGVPAGAVSDRVDRRRLLRGAELGLIVAFGAFALVSFQGEIGLALTLVIVMVLGRCERSTTRCASATPSTSGAPLTRSPPSVGSP